MGAEGGGDQVTENQKKRGFVGETIRGVKDYFDLIKRSMNGEDVVTSWSDTPVAHSPDWIEKTSIGILDVGTKSLETVREMNHIPDVSLIRDKYYLTKAYEKVTS